MPRQRKVPRYPPLRVNLPPYLRARLLATSTVLGVPAEEIVATALGSRIDHLERPQLELIDRLAAESLRRTELRRRQHDR